MSDWSYVGTSLDSIDLDEYIGFVYCITRLDTNRKYIGKKLLKSKRTRAPLKGKKRKRVDFVESDYKTYWGSNEELKKEVEELGPDNFKREVLFFCKTKMELSYMEMKEQILRDVLLHEDEYYNGFVGGKIGRRGLQNLKK
jgi:hypothetical protein